jgi:hypothetical protein
MDELIRSLEGQAADSAKIRDRYPIGSEDYALNDGLAIGFAASAMKVREAKRRMAEREPAWDLADDTGPRP